MHYKKITTALMSLLFGACPILPALAHYSDEPPIRLKAEAPKARGKHGLNLTTRWPLTFRLEVEGAVALIETNESPRGRREALIYEDPDDCIDMRDFPITDPGTPYEDCPGQDELFIEFTSERFDSHDVLDDRTGNPVVRETLLDDSFVEGMLLNKAYLRNTKGKVNPVPRPQTGGDLLDGYGYGTDDDLPGLVIMADIGAARVFNPDFDLVPGVIRNIGAFVNTVSVDFLDKRDRTSLVASMHVLSGLFEPIALFDLDVDDPNVDYLRRLESGPVQAFQFDPPPTNDDELLEMLVASYAPVDFRLRAVVVEGEGPAFIHDLDYDGKYTAHDLELMGYELLSNEVRLRLILEFDLLVTDTSRGRTCPPRSLIYNDLDGNGADGAIQCSGTGGARRARRIPR